MNTIDIVNIFQILSNAKFDKVADQKDRFALLDIVLMISKDFDAFVAMQQKAEQTIPDVKERNAYINKHALEPYTRVLPTVSKRAIYELIDSNAQHITLGAAPILSKLTETTPETSE